MRRIMAMVVVLSLVMVSITGCTKPIQVYKDSVKEAKIVQLGEEIKIVQLVEEMVDLVEVLKQETAEVDAAEFDVDFDTQEAFLDNLGLVEVKEVALNLQTKIDKIREAFDEIEMDLEDEEVADLHQPLIETLDSYEEMASVIAKSAMAVEAVMLESYKVYSMAMDMNSLIMANYMSMSEDFMEGFLANQEALNEAMNVLGTDEFTNMMDSGNVDTALVDTTINQMQGVVTLINAYEANNDADTAIRDYLLELISGVVGMLQVLKDGSDTFALTAEYEDMTGYMNDITDEGSQTIEEWISALE